ncbi:MAG: preprotein translocase subunit SecA [Balneolaceae bacterium]|nr:preprotein translocase subunit SecA [Balneolaceae bacterium]MBO6545374.1 preprotein translocase subunit SecA [Balneolaceae bacterium]MBO6646770.1 preprotein translocase subunit SecA [Balneolaceae bacterium]
MIDKVGKLITKIFGSKSEKDIKSIQPIVDKIKSYGPEMEKLSDDQLKAKTEGFKNEIQEATKETRERIDEVKKQLDNIEDLSPSEHRDLADELEKLEQQELDIIEGVLNDILPEAYAVLKDTCRRFVGKSWKVAGDEVEWNMIPYDVQLVGAIVLHQGKIAEMKTGEGKTLVAIFPAFLNALAGKGVHVITVNNYLAKRDAEWNEPIFNFHDIHVDCIDRYEPNTEQRRKAYRADITYGTNNEFGFDYLRDNMVIGKEQLVQKEHHYTIIDEVDSILIDEARTPLIISGPVPHDNKSDKYIEMKPRIEALVAAQKKLVAQLVQEGQKLLDEGNEEEAGLALFRAQRGFPKNTRFKKMLQEPSIQKLIQKTEAFYLADNAKNMPVVDEYLYYAVDMKMNSIEMTEKGREFVTQKNEDSEFFVIPDLGVETSVIEKEVEELEKEKIEAVKAQDLSEEYKQKKIDEAKTEVREERESKFSELHRLFAERGDRIHTVNQLLKAYTNFEKEEEYIVQDGKVQIVDEHTGRVLSGRRYSDGLHQAIEAKENVKVEASTQTYATITLQNYFRMYHKLSGMTGTAETEEGEFNEIYELDVVVIPTNRPIQRDDKEDLVFKTKREKFKASIDKIEEYHKNGQPVLVGTTSVEVSETMSRMLQRAGIAHNVLNAKQHARESEIVKQAGQPGAVTVATNMAGRGTDIKLAPGVKENGGLAILGTERHESRRIDLQLRGRSGRQGDPGESQFFVSLEDKLMSLFMSDRVANVMDKLSFEEGEVITHPWITKSLERAQSKVEQNNFSIRKRQLEYDDVLNNQRNVIYARRKHALLGDQLRTDILGMLEELVEDMVTDHVMAGDYEGLHSEILRNLAVDVEFDGEKWRQMDEDELVEMIIARALEVYKRKEEMMAKPLYEVMKRITESNPDRRPDKVQVIFSDGLRRMRVVVDVEAALENEGREVARALEKSAVLSVIDDKWMQHLRELDSVKEGIGLRSFAQKDPLLEYKREAFDMFKQLLGMINQEAISLIWKSFPEAQMGDNQVQQAQQQKSRFDTSKMQTQHADSTGMGLQAPAQPENGNQPRPAGPNVKRKPVEVADEPGRNDHVTIQNMSSGATKEIKWKHAKRLVDEEGWVLVEK